MRRIGSLLLLILLLAGCNENNVNNESVFDLEKPPEAQIKVNGKTYETILGSYCWDAKNNLVCVSAVNGEKIIKDNQIITVKPNEKLTIHAKKIKESGNSSYNYKQKGANKYGFEIDQFVSGLTIQAPAEDGIYYFNHGIQWEGKEDSRGVIATAGANYMYAIEVKK